VSDSDCHFAKVVFQIELESKLSQRLIDPSNLLEDFRVNKVMLLANSLE